MGTTMCLGVSMRRTLAIALSSAALLFTLSTAAYAEEAKSPIFGKASATLTSVDKNKSIVGKAYYADYYGYYGILYAYYSQYYGQVAYYASSNGTKSAYYGYASNYAYYAYYYFSYASAYAYYGI